MLLQLKNTSETDHRAVPDSAVESGSIPNSGHFIERENNWTFYPDDAALPEDHAFTIVSATRFLERAHNNETLPTGVCLRPADSTTALSDYQQQLKLICIEFPVYTDGRGYTHARLLRKRLGYSGELRAVGDIRADQMLFMLRSGIDSFDCINQPDIALLKQLTARFEHNYQPSYPLPDRAIHSM